MSRISKNNYYLGIAEAVSKGSTCIRRQYGAIIVKNDGIIATGYNGSPRGEENCCDVGYCWREANNITHGKEYESCMAVHAEQNAIISASRKDMIGSTLYLVGFENGKRMEPEEVKPCKICRRMIVNAGIKEVIVKLNERVLREMRKETILENGSREEACRKFDEVKRSITDFSKESVCISGNIRNQKEGWNVVRTLF